MKKFLTSTWTMAAILMTFVLTVAVSIAAIEAKRLSGGPEVVQSDCKLLIDEVTEKAGSTVNITVPNDWPDITAPPFASTFDFRTSDHTGLVTFAGMVDEEYTNFMLYYMIVGKITETYQIVPYGLWHKQTYFGIRKPGECPDKMDEATFDRFDEAKQQEAMRLSTALPVKQ